MEVQNVKLEKQIEEDEEDWVELEPGVNEAKRLNSGESDDADESFDSNGDQTEV